MSQDILAPLGSLGYSSIKCEGTMEEIIAQGRLVAEMARSPETMAEFDKVQSLLTDAVTSIKIIEDRTRYADDDDVSALTEEARCAVRIALRALKGAAAKAAVKITDR